MHGIWTWYCVWQQRKIIVVQNANITWPLTRRTVIDVCFTGQASISSSAGAQEASKCVSAGPAVLAGVWDAFIHIYVTQLTWGMQKKGTVKLNSGSYMFRLSEKLPDRLSHNRWAGTEIISTKFANLATLVGSYIYSPSSLVCVRRQHDWHKGLVSMGWGPQHRWVHCREAHTDRWNLPHHPHKYPCWDRDWMHIRWCSPGRGYLLER